ncbi:MAG TPA: tail fiber domain-containing protein [Candidatus Flavonifractor merdavium]|nr:tail fiber domain-containing protein [Candidatus Flavonifractor merdavium]
MSDKVYLGRAVGQLSESPALAPVSKVVLLVDDDTAYFAGDETGRTVELTCPYGTQAMANNILASLRAYTYRPIQAQDALLDPAAELGDGLTVGGVYTVLAQTELTFDALMTCDGGAPGKTEQESEYQYQSPVLSDIQHQIARTRSEITKTAEEIRLYVVNEIEGVESELRLTADSLNAQISSVDGRVSSLSLSLDSIITQVSDLDGSVTKIEQKVDGITLSAKTDGNSSHLSITSQGVEISSADITFSGMVTFQELNGDPGSGATLINGAWLQTGTVIASSLYGEQIVLRPTDDWASGVIDITGASSSSSAIELRSFGALRLTGLDGDVFIQNGTDQYVHLIAQEQAADIETVVIGNANLITNMAGVYLLGLPGQRWKSAYLSEPASIGSDADMKNSVSYDVGRYDAFFDLLRPAAYRYNHGESGRYHTGFIAQDIEAAVESAGLESTDFAGYLKDQKTGEYSLRYEEFISLCVDQIQKLKQRVKKLEGIE